MSTVPGRPAVAALNHVLAGAPWAREALAAHGGRRVQLVSGPLALSLLITAHGDVASGGDETPDLTVTLPPAAALRLLTGDDAAQAEARIEGDADLAAVVRRLATGLDWDFEEDLTRVFGDIAGHRIAGALRSTAAAGRDAIERAGLAAAEYLTEEGRLSPPKAEIAAWLADVDTLRDDVERLARRIDRLERG